jgi:hypothetical protein
LVKQHLDLDEGHYHKGPLGRGQLGLAITIRRNLERGVAEPDAHQLEWQLEPVVDAAVYFREIVSTEALP